MKKPFLTGIVVGLLLGMWFGVNLGKNQPLYSNPFASVPVHMQLLQSTGSAIEKSGRAIKEQFSE